jgi:hypothetical protein
MALKGMSTTLVIIVAAIVILITALVVVTVFGGGMQNFLRFLNPWSEDTIARSQCDGACQQICLTYEGTGMPPAWSQTEVMHEGIKKKCGDLFPGGCNCQEGWFDTGGCNAYNNNPTECASHGCSYDSSTNVCS